MAAGLSLLRADRKSPAADTRTCRRQDEDAIQDDGGQVWRGGKVVKSPFIPSEARVDPLASGAGTPRLAWAHGRVGGGTALRRMRSRAGAFTTEITESTERMQGPHRSPIESFQSHLNSVPLSVFSPSSAVQSLNDVHGAGARRARRRNPPPCPLPPRGGVAWGDSDGDQRYAHA